MFEDTINMPNQRRLEILRVAKLGRNQLVSRKPESPSSYHHQVNVHYFFSAGELRRRYEYGKDSNAGS